MLKPFLIPFLRAPNRRYRVNPARAAGRNSCSAGCLLLRRPPSKFRWKP